MVHCTSHCLWSISKDETRASFRPNLCFWCHILNKGHSELKGIYLFISFTDHTRVQFLARLWFTFFLLLHFTLNKRLHWNLCPLFVCLRGICRLCFFWRWLSFALMFIFAASSPQVYFSHWNTHRKSQCQTVNTMSSEHFFKRVPVCLLFLSFSPLLCFLGFAFVLWHDWRKNKSQRHEIVSKITFFFFSFSSECTGKHRQVFPPIVLLVSNWINRASERQFPSSVCL